MCWACMPEARRLGRESQCVRVLIPDDSVGYRGFHDVLLNIVDPRQDFVHSVGNLSNSICSDMWPTITWNSRSPGVAQWYGAPSGRVRHRIVWIISD